ncbi:hypothetical protein Tco_1006226 [Tanacetum coccineum]|uniref:Uncharacterized protein n=1 Tax=Tanacetum coccineum TaxID=301880 RepID=A0ABQ5FI33_9ASTR
MQTEATEKDQKFIVMTAHQEDIVCSRDITSGAIQAIEEPAQAAEDDEDYRPQLEPSKITYMMDPLRMYRPRDPSLWFH